MKYIKRYEGKNTMNWYTKSLSKSNDLDTFEKFIFKIISNPNIEDMKMIETGNQCVFFILISKVEKEKNFKNWIGTNLLIIQKLLDINGYEVDNIEEWLDEWELKQDSNKYNL